MSLGKKLVGVNFNPSALTDVDKIKNLCADLIDLIAKHSGSVSSVNNNLICEEAILKVMDAQMWSVKAITWKD